MKFTLVDMKFVGISYFPQTAGWYLLEMRCMRMRKIFGCMTSCYYPSWVHSHRTLHHCTPFGILDVFGLHAVAEQSVAPISSSPVLPIGSNPPHGARHIYRPHRNCHVICDLYYCLCCQKWNPYDMGSLRTQCCFTWSWDTKVRTPL
jgi:hypothetical protein